MKKRKNTPQPDAAQAISSPPAREPIEAPSANKIAGVITIITAPRLAGASARSAPESPRSPLPLDQAKSEPQPHARREPPALPRVATLGAAPASALRIEAAAPTASARAPVATPTERRPRRSRRLVRGGGERPPARAPAPAGPASGSCRCLGRHSGAEGFHRAAARESKDDRGQVAAGSGRLQRAVFEFDPAFWE